MGLNDETWAMMLVTLESDKAAVLVALVETPVDLFEQSKGITTSRRFSLQALPPKSRSGPCSLSEQR